MAPEQVLGDGSIGPPADVYALAHIAFTALVGQAYWRPDSGNAVQLGLKKAVEGDIVPASSRAAAAGVALRNGFDAWFARATARDPKLRPTVRELVRGLEDLETEADRRASKTAPMSVGVRRAAEQEPTATTAQMAAASVIRAKKARSPRAWWLVILIVVAAGIVATLVLIDDAGPPAAPERSAEQSRTLLVAIAHKIVGHLQRGEYEAIGEPLSEVTRQAWPPDRRERAWQTVLGELGAFEGVGGDRHAESGESRIVWVELTFEKGTLDLKLVFDKAGEIVGVWFTNPLPHPKSHKETP